MANTLTVRVTLGQHSYATPQSKMAFFQALETRLRFGPGITEVAESDSLPPADGHSGKQRLQSIAVEGQPYSGETSGALVAYRLVSPGYFSALNIPILRGRDFSDEERHSKEHVLILGQSLAQRLFPGRNPTGERMQLSHGESNGDATDPWYTVVGVAANVKNGGLTGEELPEYYRLRRDQVEDWSCCGVWGQTAVVIVRSSLPMQTLTPWIRTQVAAIDSTVPVDIATMQQRVSKLADGPRFRTLLAGFFAASGLALAVIGLYGVISFLVAQRTQEIGVRMALGASRAGILRLVLGKSLRLVIWGTGIGLLAALGVSRVLSSQLFGVGAHDPLTFALVPLLLAGVALLATLIPARSAARVDPMVALRCE
jgi:predicted permease